ncbi:MAG: Hint domain-containing protein [Rhodobacteraceae bacterium]|nr:Hint domain-containing protein [Paracoccaceae bacterium]
MAGALGTFVVSWAQTRLDGRAAGPVGCISVGCKWSWRGEAVRLDGAKMQLGSDLVDPEFIRRQAATAMRQLKGGALPASVFCDAALIETPVHDRTFALTDGRQRYTATLLEVPELAKPLVLFVGYLPPKDSELWVIDAQIDNETLNRRTETPTGVICFTPGTVLRTSAGPKPVETLREGDKVLTKDDGPQEILWMGSRRMSGARLYAMPELRPIRFKAGALDQDRPEDDLLVSPRHKVLLKGQLATALFGTPEVFVAAQDLINDRTIMVDHSVKSLTYVHLMLPRHQVVWANGVETESFHPASTALETIQPDQRARLAEIMPEIEADPSTYGDAARRQLTAQEAELLSFEAFARH